MLPCNDVFDVMEIWGKLSHSKKSFSFLVLEAIKLNRMLTSYTLVLEILYLYFADKLVTRQEISASSAFR